MREREGQREEGRERGKEAGREREGGKEKEKRDLLFTEPLPEQPQQLGVGQAGVRNQVFH